MNFKKAMLAFGGILILGLLFGCGNVGNSTISAEKDYAAQLYDALQQADGSWEFANLKLIEGADEPGKYICMDGETMVEFSLDNPPHPMGVDTRILAFYDTEGKLLTHLSLQGDKVDYIVRNDKKGNLYVAAVLGAENQGIKTEKRKLFQYNSGNWSEEYLFMKRNEVCFSESKLTEDGYLIISEEDSETYYRWNEADAAFCFIKKYISQE